jgi:hypothetical protein
MKATYYLLVLLFAASGSSLISAQSCFTFNDNYAVYVNSSTDGTNTYTSVLIDGEGDMNITGGQGCSSINYSNALHTPIALNVITNGSSHVGGGLYGTPECPTCYLSEANNQSIAATPGVTYTFNWGGFVMCNFAGQIFSLQGTDFYSLAIATYLIQSLHPNGTADYHLQCNGESTASCGQSNYYNAPFTSTWLVEFQLYVGVHPLGLCVPPTSGLFVPYNGGDPPNCR